MKFKSSDQWSNKICGKVNAFEFDVDDEFNNNDKAINNSFIDHRGLIEVKIHLSNKSLDVGEELNFEIVFTAFQGLLF